MKIPEIYNNIILRDFFNIIKIFDPGWASANKIFYTNINKFVADYKLTIYNAINLYQNYL